MIWVKHELILAKTNIAIHIYNSAKSKSKPWHKQHDN